MIEWLGAQLGSAHHNRKMLAWTFQSFVPGGPFTRLWKEEYNKNPLTPLYGAISYETKIVTRRTHVFE